MTQKPNRNRDQRQAVWIKHKLGFSTSNVRQSLINWPLSRGYFGSRDAPKWPLPLWRGGRCREFRSECMNRPSGQEKVAVVERWPLVEVRL